MVVAVLLAATSSGAAVHWVTTLAAGSTARAKATGPAAPTGVTATCVSASTDVVTVTWTAASHATGYTVYESKTSGSYTSVASVTTLSWTSGALTKAKYKFEITSSIGTKWSSAKSAASAARTITTSPKKCS
jgi:hypothetical protein